MRVLIFLSFIVALHCGERIANAQTVLVGEQTFEVADARPDKPGLWVTARELEELTGFVVKKQGACRAEVCIPIGEDQRAMLIAADGQTQTQAIDLEAFLQIVRSRYVVDRDDKVWSISNARQNAASDSPAQALEFSLNDRFGKQVRLSDFRGRKVILFTWASW